MAHMDWKKVIQRLKKRGWSQARIGVRCGAAQSTISDLEHGRIKQPSFSLGTCLVELDKSREKVDA